MSLMVCVIGYKRIYVDVTKDKGIEELLGFI